MIPAGAPHPATLFDGHSGRRHAVTVQVTDAGLHIAPDEASPVTVPYAELERLPASPGGDKLARRGRPGWRLDFAAGLPPDIAAQLPGPARYGGWIDRFGLARVVAIGALASAALLGVVLTAPRWLAPLVPMAVERRIGDALVGDFAESTCHTPAGDAALLKLVRAVDIPGAEPVRPQVVKFGMINAVALPGNRLVLFSGLLDDLKNPDAVAGVVAHELGHARKRHVMQAMLREFGVATLLAGTSGAVPQQLIQVGGLRYSREAEAEADAFARDRLVAAGISPLPTAQFFERMATMEPGGEWTAMLESHPASATRAREFRAAVHPGQATHPALSPAEWQALAHICRDDQKARPVLSF